MLKNEIKNSSLFLEYEPIAESLGLYLVDIHKNIINKNETQICAVVMKKDGETDISDCEHFHKTVQPRLELEIGREILSMEVSTPGLLRNIKDVYEFIVFNGKQCRIYCESYSSWVEGVISGCDESSVSLKNYKIIDKNEIGDEIRLCFDDIQKAKLDYKFDNKKSGDK